LINAFFDFIKTQQLIQHRIVVEGLMCLCDRFVTLVLPSGKPTHRHIQPVVVGVVELWHTHHQKSGRTSTILELSNMMSTALPFYCGN